MISVSVPVDKAKLHKHTINEAIIYIVKLRGFICLSFMSWLLLLFNSMNTLKTSDSSAGTRKTVSSTLFKIDKVAHSPWALDGKLVKWSLKWSYSCVHHNASPDIDRVFFSALKAFCL